MSVHSGKRTERDKEQQPKEQYKELKIDKCKYCGTAHSQRQCLAFGKNEVHMGSRNNSELYAGA